MVSLPHIGYHPEGDGTTGGGQTSKGTTDHDRGEIGSEGDGELEDVDKEEGGLEDGLASDFFRPTNTLVRGRWTRMGR